eukprot:280185-Pleurochrysis_carterae.AAC.1
MRSMSAAGWLAAWLLADCFTLVWVEPVSQPSSWHSRSCRDVHEQLGGAAPKLGADGVDEMTEEVAEGGILLGSNSTGCSLSLAGTGGDFERTRAPIDGPLANMPRRAMKVWSVFQEASE